MISDVTIRLGFPGVGLQAVTLGIASEWATALDLVPVGGITHGIDVNATNTGITGAGLVPGDLATYSGASTITTNGATIEGFRMSGSVDVNADNVTFRNCLFDGGDGDGISSTFGGLTEISATSDGTLLEYCTWVGAYPGEETDFSCVLNRGTNTTARFLDLSGACNMWRDDGSDTWLEYSYIHHPFPDDGGQSHRDLIELFAVSNFTAYRCRAEMDNEETACFNLAPFGGGSADSASAVECHFDGGNMHIVVDLQGAGTLTNTRVVDCTMGGHTNPNQIGTYAALNNVDGRTIVDTEGELSSNPNAILWLGNTWQETQRVDASLGYVALSPDNDGDPITV